MNRRSNHLKTGKASRLTKFLPPAHPLRCNARCRLLSIAALSRAGDGAAKLRSPIEAVIILEPLPLKAVCAMWPLTPRFEPPPLEMRRETERQRGRGEIAPPYSRILLPPCW